jgi:iron(III) transport system permease protein
MTLTSNDAEAAAPPLAAKPPEDPPGTLPALVTRHGGKAAWYVFVVALAFVVLTPIVYFYSLAFEGGAAPITNLPNVPNIGEIIYTTVLLAFGSTVIAAVVAVALAVLVMRVPLRWRGVAAFLPQLPLVIPPVAMIIGWIFIFAPTVGYGNTLLRELPMFDHLREGPVNIYSLPAIILITGIDLAGIVFALVYARLHEISGSLNAAARLAGASSVRAFFTVTLPLLRPSLVAGVVVAFLLGLGQFTAPLLLGSAHGVDVLTTEIFHIRERYPIDYAATAALGLPLLVIGVVSIVIQRAVIGDQRRYVTQAAGGGMGGQNRMWALWVVLGYGAITVVLPLIALTLVAFSPFWNGDLSNLTFTTRHFTTTLDNPDVRESIINSVVTSILAALIVLPIGFVAALAMSGVLKAPRPVQYVLDLIFVAPLAVPRAMLGMAVLFVFLQEPFNLYGTYTLFVVGYAFVVLPFALRSQYSSLVGVHGSLFEASRVCGAGQLRTIWSVALPLTKRGMSAALAIMVILLSHDFAVSVMLRSPGNHVMGTVIYEFWSTGVFPQVAVMALVMTVVTGVLLAVTLKVGGRSALENL